MPQGYVDKTRKFLCIDYASGPCDYSVAMVVHIDPPRGATVLGYVAMEFGQDFQQAAADLLKKLGPVDAVLKEHGNG